MVRIVFFSGERCQAYPDFKEEFHRKLEFNTCAVNILNNLEVMGYKVVSSGSFVASQQFDKKVTFSTFCHTQTKLTIPSRAINWLYVVNREISMVNTIVGCYGKQDISFTALRRKSIRCIKWSLYSLLVVLDGK